MASDPHAIRGSVHTDRYDFENLASSPPALEDGAFFKLRFRETEPQMEERPSTYKKNESSNLVNSLMSAIEDAESGNTHTQRPMERRRRVGGTLTFDPFGALQFDEFEEAAHTRIPAAHPQVAPPTSPAFGTLDHSEKVKESYDSNSTIHSKNEVKEYLNKVNLQEEDNVYADESLDSSHLQFPKTSMNNPERKSSIILDRLTSLNIKAALFENEGEQYPKRKNSNIADIPEFPTDIDVAKQENKEFASNMQIQSLSPYDTKSLKLSNEHVSISEQNELEDSGADKKRERKISFGLQSEANTFGSGPSHSQSSGDLIRHESSYAPMKRRLSSSIVGFFTGGIGESAGESQSSDDLIKAESQSSDDLIKAEYSNAPPKGRKLSLVEIFRGGISELPTESTVERAQSSYDLSSHEPPNSSTKERKISTSIIDFFRGSIMESVSESSIERAQEVKEIADMNMVFRY
ncbi:unnamed protein product [Meganyctiphanes norvegica]|uniref:Uncharacterized protein n=1 Tax=Meganyctiphanes norvegica TaxID=48144 RepID=A0AAV2QNW3_MEGNR